MNEIKILKKLIKESFDNALKEGSDGNYMTEQDLNVIDNSVEIIRRHIDFESVPDWVENSIAKLAGELTSLRNYYESGTEKPHSDDFENDSEESEEEELEYEIGEEDEDEDEDNEEEEIEEGIGTSHTIKRGANVKPVYNKSKSKKSNKKMPN